MRFRRRLRDSYGEQLRSSNTVRSIQRVRLPPGRDASWLSRRYFNWLTAYLNPFIECQTLENSSYCMRINGLQTCLLRLEFSPERSSADRQVYAITEGLLASRARNSHGRMEFREVPGGSHAMIAIHDFAPAMPWHFYLATQAAIHRVVMGAFQKYIESRGEEETSY